MKRYLDDISNLYSRVILENQNNSIPPQIKKGIEELAKKAVEGDEEAIKMLTDPEYAANVLNKAKQQEDNDESEELYGEAFEKLRANLGSKFNSSADAIERRYNLLLSDINGHLWEIEKDSKSLNVNPEFVNNFIQKIIKVEPNIDKKGKLLQKIGYSIGRAAGNIAFATPFAIAASYLAPVMGLYGISAKLLGGVLAAGGKTATILNNKQLSDAEKVSQIVSVAIAGYGATFTDAVPVDAAPVDATQEIAQSSTSTPSVDTEFPELHGTSYDNLSQLDRAKQAVADLLKDKGIVGSSGGVDGIASPTIMNAMDSAGINTTAEYSKVLKGLQSLSHDQLKFMQNDPNVAIKALKQLNK